MNTTFTILTCSFLGIALISFLVAMFTCFNFNKLKYPMTWMLVSMLIFPLSVVFATICGFIRIYYCITG